MATWLIWMVKSFDGRGARTAHLVRPGRRAVCGTPLSHGNLLMVEDDSPTHRCQRCLAWEKATS